MITSMITLKEAFENLHDRMMKQLAETIWTMERIKPMNQKEVEKFQGKTVKKNLLLKSLKQELKERTENLESIKKIIKRHEK